MRQERHTVERERVAEQSSSKKFVSCNCCEFSFFKCVIMVFFSFFLFRFHFRHNNVQSLDRNRRGHSQRSARAQSVARFEDANHSQSKGATESNIRDYTMTLPASRGRHRSRINGILLQNHGFLFSGRKFILIRFFF